MEKKIIYKIKFSTQIIITIVYRYVIYIFDLALINFFWNCI